MRSTRWSATLTVLTLIGTPAALRSQGNTEKGHTDSATARIEAVKRQRQGAGLRIGTWQTTGLTTVSGATYSTLPAFEGYWQKGLDKHVVMETSGGFWGRTQRSSSGRISSFTIPMLTSIKIYPSTVPGDQLEPFILAGGGFSIGVDDRNDASGSLLGGGGQTGTALIIGLGLKGGGGLEIHMGQAFGLQVGAGYQWIHFLDVVGGNQEYKGAVIYGGLTYRFQY